MNNEVKRSETKLNGVIGTSLDHIKEIADVNTVIGEPINTPSGTIIIPVSKVSLGFVSGGTDYVAKKNATTEKRDSFAGGGGTGITLNPVGFLVIKPEGDVEFISADTKADKNTPVESVIGFIEKSPELIESLKKVFAKKDKKKNDDSDDEKSE